MHSWKPWLVRLNQTLKYLPHWWKPKNWSPVHLKEVVSGSLQVNSWVNQHCCAILTNPCKRTVYTSFPFYIAEGEVRGQTRSYNEWKCLYLALLSLTLQISCVLLTDNNRFSLEPVVSRGTMSLLQNAQISALCPTIHLYAPTANVCWYVHQIKMRRKIMCWCSMM